MDVAREESPTRFQNDYPGRGNEVGPRERDVRAVGGSARPLQKPRERSRVTNSEPISDATRIQESTTMRTRIHAAVLALALVPLALPGATEDLSAQEDRSYVDARSADDPDAAPFSGAVQTGNTLYVSGSLGLTEDGEVPETPEEEARNVLDNIQSTLEEAGFTMDDLVQVQVFCSDVSYYEAFNSVYRTYFNREFPARAFLGAGPLLADARFEVMGIAVKR